MSRDLPSWYRPPEQRTPRSGADDDARSRAGVRGSPVYYHDAPRPPEGDATSTAVAEPQPAEPGTEEQVADPASTSATAPLSPAAEQQTQHTDVARTGLAIPRAVPRRATGTALLALLAVAAVLLIGHAVFNWFSGSHPVSTPRQIGALMLQAASTASQQHVLAVQGWDDVHGGYYGTVGITQILVLTGRPPDEMSSSDTLAQGLASQLVQEALVFNPKTATSGEAEGTRVVCGPAASASGVVDVCAWTDGAGIVVDYSGESISQTRVRTLLARSASER
jgi:hypothetical protein